LDYLPILILFAVAAGFAVGAIALSFVLGPRRPNAQKLEPYECGMSPIGNTRGRFPIRFYLVAMLFILFDIEIIFLYPWAVLYLQPGANRLFLLGEIVVFIAILVIGYVYVWRKGALDWED